MHVTHTNIGTAGQLWCEEPCPWQTVWNVSGEIFHTFFKGTCEINPVQKLPWRIFLVRIPPPSCGCNLCGHEGQTSTCQWGSLPRVCPKICRQALCCTNFPLVVCLSWELLPPRAPTVCSANSHGSGRGGGGSVRPPSEPAVPTTRPESGSSQTSQYTCDPCHR